MSEKKRWAFGSDYSELDHDGNFCVEDLRTALLDYDPNLPVHFQFRGIAVAIQGVASDTGKSNNPTMVLLVGPPQTI